MSLAQFGVGNRSYSFNRFAAGKISGSTSAFRGPDVPCEMVMLVTESDNAGNVYIGGENVSSEEGVALAAEQSLGWIPVSNLSAIWFVMDNADDTVKYAIVR